MKAETLWSRLISNEIVVALGVALAIWILYQSRYVVIVAILAYILTLGLLPVISRVEKRLPHWAAVVVPYFLLLLLLSGFLALLFPTIISQSQSLVEIISSYAGSSERFVAPGGIWERVGQALAGVASNLAQGIFSVLGQTVQIAVAIFAIFVLSIYLALDHAQIKRGLVKIFHREKQDKVAQLISKIESDLGAWLGGQLIIAFIVGSTVGVSLAILGLPYALTLGILAGLLEFIPYLGPIISAVPAVAIGLSQSLWLAGLVVIIFIIIQILENNLIVPLVMERRLDLHPAVVIVAVLSGAALLGVIGALLAVPTVKVLKTVLDDLRRPVNANFTP